MRCSIHPWTIRTDRGCPTCAIATIVEEQRELEAKTERERERRRRKSASARVEGGHKASLKTRISKAASVREIAIRLLIEGDMSAQEISEKLGKSRSWVCDAARNHADLAHALNENRRIRRERGTIGPYEVRNRRWA